MEFCALKEIVQVNPGYLARERLESSDNSNARILQLRDVKRDGEIAYDSAQRVNLCHSDIEKYYVRDDDILLVNRGENIRAVRLEKPPTNTLFSAHFFVLRPMSPRIRNDFLTWYLNHNLAQNYIHKNAAGTSVRVLSKHVVEELPIGLPNLQKQEQLGALYALTQQHRALTNRLQAQMDRLISSISLNDILESP